MERFKYSLDKTSKKYVCPNCNKKTFVYYVDTDKGNYLPSDFGRCDRERNCNYHKAPSKGKRAFLIAFLSLIDISAKASKLTDLNGVISIVPKSQIFEQNERSCFISEWYLKDSKINYHASEIKYFNSDNSIYVNKSVRVETIQKKTSFHNIELLDKMYFENSINDNLTEFLKRKFSPDEVSKVILNYFITGSNLCWSKSTVFWQIDEKEQIRGAKIMLYNSNTGSRIKKPYNHINWLHKAIKEPEFNLNQCLFGLHLINDDYQKDIAIVESEKTAIIMSVILPEYIWLATGSKSNFKLDLLKPLKGRNCYAFPDKGEFMDWNKKATELKSQGFKIAVSDIIEQTDFQNGYDLADYYLSDEMHEMHEMKP